MTQFITNHPIWTAVIFFYLLFVSKFIIRAVYETVKGNYKNRIKKLKQTVKELEQENEQNEDYTRFIESEYLSVLQENNLRSNLKQIAKEQGKERPAINQEQVEDMADTLNQMLKESKYKIDNYPKILQMNIDLKKSFSDSCDRIRQLEKENYYLHDQVMTLEADNMLLKNYDPREHLKTLQDHNDLLNFTCEEQKRTIKELRERATRLQETIEHRKHTKVEPKNTGYWRAKKDLLGYFKEGEVYEEMNLHDGLFRLHAVGNNPTMDVSRSWVVDKQWFTPAPVPENNLQNNSQKVAEKEN